MKEWRVFGGFPFNKVLRRRGMNKSARVIDGCTTASAVCSLSECVFTLKPRSFTDAPNRWTEPRRRKSDGSHAELSGEVTAAFPAPPPASEFSLCGLDTPFDG
ncbi:unnamed protein product [Tetraodon nigroviridis]|uniref:(spotted green pufferfish) hypothetical protein n=1 Tax=Tetraodon nigroviridis TaxID=99883 RepID=Q4S1V5_TETNG|nr:unnamed protein product [Tetraodon nigroviridis]